MKYSKSAQWLKKTLTGLLAIPLFGGLLYSCDDANNWHTDTSALRMFQPVTFTIADPAANSIAVTFSKVSGAAGYYFEISKDSLLFENIIQQLTVQADTLTEDNSSSSSTKYTITIDGLEGSTQYSLRMKVPGVSGAADSKWIQAAFVTEGEQIFTAILPEEKTDSTIVLHWDAQGVPVTHIMLAKTDDTELRIELDDTDNATAKKLITGLEASTNYTASIYNNINKRGEISFRTSDAVMEGSTVYYLNGTENLAEVLDTISKNNITLMLPAGSNFQTSWVDSTTAATSYSLPIPDHITSLTLWGEEGTAAQINCTSIKLGAGISNIILRHVEFYGTSASADYVINEGTTHSLTEVLFDNCDLHTYRGIFRMKESNNYSIISTLTIRECLIHDIGGYGIINGETNVLFDNILFENTTFYTVETFITLKKQGSSLLINNCTFYNTIVSGKYFFSFNKDLSIVPAIFMMKDCIFGKTGAGTDENNTARGTNPKVSETFVQGSYCTNDFYIAGGYPMTGLTEVYSGTSTDLFVDPANADFHFKDSDFAGKATTGDPRWW